MTEKIEKVRAEVEWH